MKVAECLDLAMAQEARIRVALVRLALEFEDQALSAEAHAAALLGPNVTARR